MNEIIDTLDTAKPLDVIFQPYQTTLEKWEAKVVSLIVTDINQKTEMAQARLARLELRDARVTLDKTRKGLTERLKARTSAIDGAARAIREKLESLESRLLDSEQFAERHAAKLKAELRYAREKELFSFLDNTAAPSGDLSELSDAAYATVLSDARILRQAKLDAAAKESAEREAREVERLRMAEENAKLRAEAETQRAAQLKAQAEANEIKAKAEREATVLRAVQIKIQAESDRVTAEARREAAVLRAELEEKEKAEAAEKARLRKLARLAAAAPDTEKLQALAEAFRKIKLPTLDNVSVMRAVEKKVDELAKWVVLQIDGL